MDRSPASPSLFHWHDRPTAAATGAWPDDGKAYGVTGQCGIKVCERWRDARNFFADMGDKPSKEMKLCRFDMDGDYEPGNCYWGTAKEASGSSTHAVRVLIDGRAVSMNQAGKLLGLGTSRRLYTQMKNWGLTHQEAVDRFAKREDVE